MTSNRFAPALGLTPTRSYLVGQGFSREELKDALLATGQGFVAEAVQGLSDLALTIVNVERAERKRPLLSRTSILRPTSRQEMAGRLLSEPRLREALPELSRLKRQTAFTRRLDRALQASRMAFAHDGELSVLFERLLERGLENPLREEFFRFAQAYEAYLDAKSLRDEPMLLAEATRVLSERDCRVLLDREWVYLSAARPQAREEAFLEAVAHQGGCVVREPLQVGAQAGPIEWERWHTIDDAVEGVADQVNPERDAVLIADLPEVRRSLSRALRDRGILLEDSRDPTALRMSEELKLALLPLRLVARGFERTDVISWCLRARDEVARETAAAWVDRIETFGLRKGLESYQRAGLDILARELTELENLFQGRKKVPELANAHLEWVKNQEPGLQLWLPLIERQWRELADDLRRIDRQDRRAPLLYHLTRFEERLNEAKPPPLELKVQGGLRVFRLSQAPLLWAGRPIERLFIVGMPARWLDEEGEGDLGLTERERLVLGQEFAVRSGAWRREERLAILQAWRASAEQCVVVDAEYDLAGREMEGLRPLLVELFGTDNAPENPAKRDGHERWLPSFGPRSWLPPLDSRLSELPAGTDVSATTIDAYSRCEFLGIAQGRWRLRDLRESDLEMWGSAFGNLLHGVARKLVEGQGLEQALEESWRENPPLGLVRSRRLEAIARARARKVAESFVEDERAFRERADTRTFALEGPALRFELGGLFIKGTPDRVEEAGDSLFLIDYKTAAQNFGAREMVEQTFGLQLPLYGIGLRKLTGREVVGAQFVELTKQGARARGLLFKAYNGKEPGKLTNSRAYASLRPESPGELWSLLEERAAQVVATYREGWARVQPKRPARDCGSCQQYDVCGRRRVDASGRGSE